MSNPSLANISTAVLHLIQKSVANELKNRERLAVDTYCHEASATINVTGTVKVCPDENFRPTTSIPMKAAFALFLRYAGITGPAAMSALVRAMREVADMQRSGSKDRLQAIEELADIQAAMEKVEESLDELPEETRKGKVIVKVL